MLIIEVDHVGIPVLVLLMTEQWGITGHLHDITVALDVTQIDSLGEGTLYVTAALVAIAAPLSEIDLSLRTVITVVVILVVQEPTGTLIVVLIHHLRQFGVLMVKAPSLDIVAGWGMERSCRSTDNDIGVTLMDSAGDQFVTLLEGGAHQVFITDTDIFKVERCRMTSLCAFLSPFIGGWVTIGPFDQMEDIVDI